MRLRPERATGMKLSICRSGSSEAKIGAHHRIEIEPATLQVVPGAFDDNQGVRGGSSGSDQNSIEFWLVVVSRPRCELPPQAKSMSTWGLSKLSFFALSNAGSRGFFFVT